MLNELAIYLPIRTSLYIRRVVIADMYFKLLQRTRGLDHFHFIMHSNCGDNLDAVYSRDRYAYYMSHTHTNTEGLIQ